MAGRLYRNVPANQEDLITELTRRYAGLGIRFDTGFVGSVPVQASGRIGRRFFYFRFRGDTASLSIGNPELRADASRAKLNRRRSLRKFRRGITDDWFGDFLITRDLRRDDSLDRHPSRAVRYAVINDVTGDQYNGFLEPEEAGALFVRLMENLVPARKPLMASRHYRVLIKGQRSWPMESTGVITKGTKRRR